MSAWSYVPVSNSLRQESFSRVVDVGIPRHQDFAIAARGLFDVGESGERVMEALNQHLFGHEHVVDLSARGFGHDRVLIDRCMPTRICDEQHRNMRHVPLDEYAAGAGGQNERRMPDGGPGRSNGGEPGRSLLVFPVRRALATKAAKNPAAVLEQTLHPALPPPAHLAVAPPQFPSTAPPN